MTETKKIKTDNTWGKINQKNKIVTVTKATLGVSKNRNSYC